MMEMKNGEAIEPTKKEVISFIVLVFLSIFVPYAIGFWAWGGSASVFGFTTGIICFMSGVAWGKFSKEPPW